MNNLMPTPLQSGCYSNRDERLFSLFSCCLHAKRHPLSDWFWKGVPWRFLELGRTLYFILSSVTMYRHLTFCCTCRPHVLHCFQPWGTWASGIHFRYCFDDLFWSVIIVFVPVLPETACLSPWFIVYLLPCACCQFVVHRIHCYRVLYFPVLPPARINHGIWRNRSTHVVLLLTHSYSVLCLVMICFPSFLIIRGRTGNTEYFRVRIPDIQIFIDHLWVFALGVNEMFKTISIPSESLTLSE